MRESRLIVIESKNDLAGVIWVNSARCRDKTRMSITKLQVEAGVAIATDGRRLHKYTLEEPVPDGLYDPLIINQSRVLLIDNPEDCKYPDTERIAELPELVCDLSPYADEAAVQILRQGTGGDYFNLGYLLAALAFNRPAVFHCAGREGDPAHVRTHDGHYHAVVMPCSARPPKKK